jgi:hypothetical protein
MKTIPEVGCPTLCGVQRVGGTEAHKAEAK